MKLKKKIRKFGNELAEVLGDNATLNPELVSYVMAHAMIQMMTEEYDPAEGLNLMFENIRIAASEQGYRLIIPSGNSTVH